jgi:DNA-binding CsgD family transcriptional regulator
MNERGHIKGSIPAATLAVLGLSTIWPSLLNGFLYPVSLAGGKIEQLDAQVLLIIYSLGLAVFSGIVFVLRNRMVTLLRNRLVLSICGVLGTTGALLLQSAKPINNSTFIMAAIGAALIIVYCVIVFVFWSSSLVGGGANCLPVAAFSYAICACMNLIRIPLAISDSHVAVAFPVFQILLINLAINRQRKNEVADESKAIQLEVAQDRGFSALGKLGWGVAVPSLLLSYLGTMGVVFFNTGALTDIFDVSSSLPVKFLLPSLNIVIFFGIALALRWSKNANETIVAIFGLLSVLLVGAILSSAFASQYQTNIGSLPNLAGTLVFQVFTWLILLQSSRVSHISQLGLAPLYIMAAIAVPKLLKTVFMFNTAFLDYPPDTNMAFIWVACASFVAVAVVFAFLLYSFSRALSSRQKTHLNLSGQTVCEEIAHTYKLSKRESEVVLLLRNGYSAKSIAGMLFVSESTVHTHTKRIYRKLGIHSKQELIRLIDEVE